jgi:hypothetical protein
MGDGMMTDTKKPKRKKPKLSISRRKDGTFMAAYLRIQPGKVTRTEELVAGMVIADYGSNDKLLGIEILSCDIEELA